MQSSKRVEDEPVRRLPNDRAYILVRRVELISIVQTKDRINGSRSEEEEQKSQFNTTHTHPLAAEKGKRRRRKKKKRQEELMLSEEVQTR
jgi:hypothetical protein